MGRINNSLSIIFLLAILLVSIVVALSFGSVRIPLGALLRISLGLDDPDMASKLRSVYEVILFDLRLPRVLLAGLVGGGLAISGTVIQGVFRNPMADPGIIGVTSGAALGAIIAISSGIAFDHPFALPAFAFPGATIAVFLVYGLASSKGRTPVSAVLLSGIAVSSLLMALNSFIISLSESVFVLREMIFWIMGGLEGRGWSHLSLACFPALFGCFLIMAFTRDLNIMALESEEGAMSLGVDTRRVTQILLALSALVTASVVSVSGGISFVGLVVPHLLRLFLGPNHKVLIPASFIGGATFLILTDLVSRIAFPSEELRLGIVTSMVGAPFFLILLQRNLRRSSGLS